MSISNRPCFSRTLIVPVYRGGELVSSHKSQSKPKVFQVTGPEYRTSGHGGKLETDRRTHHRNETLHDSVSLFRA